jgi:hypothetical protein
VPVNQLPAQNTRSITALIALCSVRERRKRADKSTGIGLQLLPTNQKAGSSNLSGRTT